MKLNGLAVQMFLSILFTICPYICQASQLSVRSNDIQDAVKFLLTYGNAVGEDNSTNLVNQSAVTQGVGSSTRDCLVALTLINYGIMNRETWALEFLDAQAKIPAGIKNGRLTFLGAFDECLEIRHTEKRLPCGGRKDCEIQGQYCTVYMGNYLPDMLTQTETVFRVGLCLPTLCTPDILEPVFKKARETFNVSVGVTACSTSDPVPLNRSQTAIISIYSIIVSLLFVGLVLDVYCRVTYQNEKSKVLQCLIAFSPYTNVRKIFYVSEERGRLDCLNGMRFLSMCWIILSHTYIFLNVPNLTNAVVLQTIFSDAAFQIVANGTLAVDTFFFIGGLLVAYITLDQLDKRNGKLNWALFYVHRYFRITPAFGLILAVTFLVPLIGSGPFWKESIHVILKPCEERWFTALFFISNLIHEDSKCMVHSWYLANDMQFTIITPLILIALYKFNKWGHGVTGGILLMSTITTFCLLFIGKYPAPSIAQIDFGPKALEFMNNVYMKPYVRIGPYLIGITVGYLILRHAAQIREFFLNNTRYLILGWFLSTGFALGCIFGLLPWNQKVDLNTLTTAHYFYTALYGAFFRNVWTVAIGWVVLACACEFGGLINKFLSWGFFAPLGRLTFCAYLIHPLLIYVDEAQQRHSITFTSYAMVSQFFSFLLFAYGFALILTLAFEAPFIGLEKVLLTPKQKEIQSQSLISESNSTLETDEDESRSEEQ